MESGLVLLMCPLGICLPNLWLYSLDALLHATGVASWVFLGPTVLRAHKTLVVPVIISSNAARLPLHLFD